MYIPPGFGTVTPYLFVDDADKFVKFLCAAFGGIEVGRSLRPDHKIANAQVRIGSSTLMISESSQDYQAMPSCFYLYVEDADLALERATSAGASVKMEVAEMPYGDRQGGVLDPFGNIWWVSQRLEKKAYF